MTSEDLIQNNYKQFNPHTDKPYISKAFQKRVWSDDQETTLYFITVYEYSFPIHGDLHIGYEAEVQLYQKETRNAVNLTYLNGWTVESLEKDIKAIYNTGNYEPYDHD